MKAEIISVGTEILLGEIVDTNASWIAARLPALGVDLYYKSVVGDNLDRVVDTLERALDRSDLVIMTGGLGPTDDDLTRESIAAALGEEMYIDEDMSRALEAFFKSRGLGFPERNRKQAGLIPSASALLNPRGTAPGWWVEKTQPDKGDRYIVARVRLRCMSMRPIAPSSVSSSAPQTIGPRRRRASSSTGAMSSRASSRVEALAPMRT